MIFVSKDRILHYKNKKIRCSVGSNGFTKNKIEGDKKTPIGTYNFGKLFIRKDRIKNINTKFKLIEIKKYMAWSDDPNKSNYNKLIKTKKNHKESLYRDDNLYDLILVINYNMHPIIANRGSAIFIHVSSDDYKSTNGCIAIKIDDFIEILATLNPNDKITIIK